VGISELGSSRVSAGNGFTHDRRRYGCRARSRRARRGQASLDEHIARCFRFDNGAIEVGMRLAPIVDFLVTRHTEKGG
jgi:hypothetical protein